ncbi:hypothetical protein [Flavobacterium sp. NRK1]|uniref:hypothetical protein n=1 Tax=Flavobacterium sp. NRK1 TaxID=2954929 RepID=UPI0020932329|nr:hypothetical protein [Flavobacterium sp. NRK1]MCO6149048.1 hypothetical protein [Flavobacterium sp. NRK1]
MKYIIYIVIALLFISCGMRKVNRQHQESTKVTETAKTETKEAVTEIQSNEVLVSNTDDIVITPVDSSKPLEIIDHTGKTTILKNARIERKKQNITSNTLVTEKKQETEKKEVNNKATEQSSSDSKTSERDINFYSWFFWFILLVIVLYLISKVKSSFS